MMNQTEGNNQYKTYQPELGALVNQFLTLITVTVQESVNHAAKNVFWNSTCKSSAMIQMREQTAF
jgi:hypothetical protein